MPQAANLPDTPRRIHEAFSPWIESRAESIALMDADRAISYGELGRVVEAVAERLTEAGVRAGDRVLLVAENAVSMAVCILAVSRLDAWSATVNARVSAREIDNFFAHSGARRALYFSAVSSDANAHGLARGAQPVVWPGIGELLLGPLNAAAEPEPVERDAAQQVAVLVYTSGTTGAPKAVMLTHANLLFIGANSCRMRELAPTDIVYGVLPLSHVYGLSALLVASLMSGAALCLVPRYQASELARALAEDRKSVV